MSIQGTARTNKAMKMMRQFDEDIAGNISDEWLMLMHDCVTSELAFTQSSNNNSQTKAISFHSYEQNTIRCPIPSIITYKSRYSLKNL